MRIICGPLVAQTVKRLSTMQETQVQSLGWEDPLEKEMATHSSILTREIPWTEKTSGLQSMGQRVGRGLATKRQQQQHTKLKNNKDFNSNIIKNGNSQIYT